MRKIVLFLVLSVILLLAACENKTDTAMQQTTQQASQQTTKSGAAETQAKGLKDIFAGQKVKYTADYKITTEGNTMNTRYIMDLPRFAMETEMEQGESKSIYDGTTFYVCSKIESEWQCFKMPVQNPDAVETEKGVNEGTIKPVYSGTCSHAGESGLKYSLTAKGATSTVCYTTDGILLEITTSKMTMTATKVTRTVAADAFVAPAEPVSLPNIPE